MLDEYSWNMTGYIAKYGFQITDTGLTRKEAERIFQIVPEPPETGSLNDYILMAKQEKNLDHFSCFLHHYERQLNGRIYNFLRNDGTERYDPERFLDMKLACMEAMLVKIPDYDPNKGAVFTTYVYQFVEDAMLDFRRNEEGWSTTSLDSYKRLRSIAWIYHNSEGESEAVQKYAAEKGCSIETARQHLKEAHALRRRVPYYVTMQEEDGEETGEEVGRDDFWNYASLIHGQIQASAIWKAFQKLNYKEQTYLEQRNAICMNCGRVSPLSSRMTFEDLAVMFEGSTASGAERFYRKTLDKLTTMLAENGILHAVRLKQTEQKKSKKKIATATYQYQADCDGEWGEIRFDFEQGTAEIVKLADWDTTISHIFAEKAIEYLLTCENEKLPRETLVAFEE